MNTQIIRNVLDTFQSAFKSEPLLVKAPGRINLIGEHTDYNNGFVLPAAVDQSIYLAIAKSGDADQCSLISLDMDERYDFKISEISPLPANSWQNYLVGVVAQVVGSGHQLQGFNVVFSGDVPRGSGMSSSAALECGTCFGLNELFDLKISKVDMVKLSQKAEHTYAGVMCGIMDQFASMMGQENHALLLDCQTLEYRLFPIVLEEYTLMLCNSNVQHNLASSEYNVRRKQCDEGVAILQKKYSDIASLRDITMEMLASCQSDLDEVVYKRCEYVVKENARVLEMTKMMESGDLSGLGEILTIAEEGMRHEYEITCPEIDFMADFANSREDVLGARMMGGGFGGCTINLVKKGCEDEFVKELGAAYQVKFQKEITPIQVKIADGVKLINQS